MDAPTSLERDSSYALREQISQTQRQLGVKLGALEGEVRAVTTHARDAIRERISDARDVVDIRRQVARHPWVWSAIAVGAGVLVGRRTRGGRVDSYESPRSSFVRGVVAPHVATLQSVLVSRLLSLMAERLKERIVGLAEASEASGATE